MPVMDQKEFLARLADGALRDNDYRFAETHHRVLAALREAVAQRDMEWWEAVVLVDNVAPEPEAAKRWIAVSQDYHIKQAVAQERAALRDGIASVQTCECKGSFVCDKHALLEWLDARDREKA